MQPRERKPRSSGGTRRAEGAGTRREASTREGTTREGTTREGTAREGTTREGTTRESVERQAPASAHPPASERRPLAPARPAPASASFAPPATTPPAGPAGKSVATPPAGASPPTPSAPVHAPTPASASHRKSSSEGASASEGAAASGRSSISGSGGSSESAGPGELPRRRELELGVGRSRAHPDSGLTSEQTQTLHRALLENRRSLLQEHFEHLDSGRFNTERIAESEEAAAWDTSQSTLIDLAESERRRLVEIERALRKLQDGTYGVSEESGEPIGFDRLRAIPWARLSAADQEDYERRTRDRGR